MKQDSHHYRKSDSRLKQAICILSSFLLAVVLTVLALFSAVKIGYMNESQVIKAFKDSNYYNSVYKSMISDCENEAIVSGLSAEVFNGVFSLNELTAYCDSYVSALINDREYNFDTSSIEKKLSENIQNYTTTNNLVVDGDINTVIASFTSTITAYYKSSVQFPYFDQIASIFRLFDKLILYVLPFMLILAVILIILLFRLNTFKKNRRYRYMSYSFLSSSISILVIPVFSYLTGFYKRLSFSPEYVYKYIITYFGNGLKILTITGILLFTAGIVCIITSAVIKKKLKNQHVPVSHHHEIDSEE